jgi:hypothetical protein
LSKARFPCIHLREICPPNQDLGNDVIKEVLVRNGRRDTTDPFVAKWRFGNESSKIFKENCKSSLIGRNDRIVPWNIEK